MKRSSKVVLTLVAAMGVSARAQQPVDPCDAATFNGKVCQAAVAHRGYCSPSGWVSITFPQKYPYYYDLYSQFLVGGGVAQPAETGTCPRNYSSFHGASYGGFGSTGAGHSSSC